MATNIPNQHVHVEAKDLLIAALEAGQILLSGRTASDRATQLGEAYVALLSKMRDKAPAV